jgi:hypothetical protein
MECPVCLEELGTRIETRLPCKHSVCLTCLLRLPAPVRCPMCRADVSRHMPDPSTSTVTVQSVVDGLRITDRLSAAMDLRRMTRVHASPILLQTPPRRRLILAAEEEEEEA